MHNFFSCHIFFSVPFLPFRPTLCAPLMTVFSSFHFCYSPFPLLSFSGFFHYSLLFRPSFNFSVPSLFFFFSLPLSYYIFFFSILMIFTPLSPLYPLFSHTPTLSFFFSLFSSPRLFSLSLHFTEGPFYQTWFLLRLFLLLYLLIPRVYVTFCLPPHWNPRR